MPAVTTDSSFHQPVTPAVRSVQQPPGRREQTLGPQQDSAALSHRELKSKQVSFSSDLEVVLGDDLHCSEPELRAEADMKVSKVRKLP